MSEDVIDTLAGISGSALAELRRQRPDVVKHLQGSDDVIFAPAGRWRPHARRARRRGAAGRAFPRPAVANGALRTWLDLQLAPPSRD